MLTPNLYLKHCAGAPWVASASHLWPSTNPQISAWKTPHFRNGNKRAGSWAGPSPSLPLISSAPKDHLWGQSTAVSVYLEYRDQTTFLSRQALRFSPISSLLDENELQRWLCALLCTRPRTCGSLTQRGGMFLQLKSRFCEVQQPPTAPSPPQRKPALSQPGQVL